MSHKLKACVQLLRMIISGTIFAYCAWLDFNKCLKICYDLRVKGHDQLLLKSAEMQAF